MVKETSDEKFRLNRLPEKTFQHSIFLANMYVASHILKHFHGTVEKVRFAEDRRMKETEYKGKAWNYKSICPKTCTVFSESVFVQRWRIYTPLNSQRKTCKIRPRTWE